MAAVAVDQSRASVDSQALVALVARCSWETSIRPACHHSPTSRIADRSTSSTVRSSPRVSRATSRVRAMLPGARSRAPCRNASTSGPGDGPVAGLHQGGRLDRTPALGDQVAHPTEPVELVEGVSAVTAAASVGDRHSVPALPRANSRCRHIQCLGGLLDAQLVAVARCPSAALSGTTMSQSLDCDREQDHTCPLPRSRPLGRSPNLCSRLGICISSTIVYGCTKVIHPEVRGFL